MLNKNNISRNENNSNCQKKTKTKKNNNNSNNNKINKKKETMINLRNIRKTIVILLQINKYNNSKRHTK